MTEFYKHPLARWAVVASAVGALVLPTTGCGSANKNATWTPGIQQCNNFTTPSGFTSLNAAQTELLKNGDVGITGSVVDTLQPQLTGRDTLVIEAYTAAQANQVSAAAGATIEKQLGIEHPALVSANTAIKAGAAQFLLANCYS